MTTYEKMLNDFLNAQKLNQDQLTLFFVGKRGMGKTKTVKNFAKKSGLDLFTLNLAAIDSVDFTGIPTIENNLTVYSKPKFLDLKNSILFLDEINRVINSDVKSCLLSLLVDREINGHKLDKSVFIVAAGNPNDDDHDVNDFDAALKDRLVMVEFQPTLKDFLEYLNLNHKKSTFLDFINCSMQSLTNYSYRRLEYTLNFLETSKNIEMIQNLLSYSTYQLYIEYLSNNIHSFQDIKKGKIENLENLDITSQKKLLNDFKEYLLSDDILGIKANESKNINTFLNAMREENKLEFFEFIKQCFLENKINEEKQKVISSKKLFEGLKDLKNIFLGE